MQKSDSSTIQIPRAILSGTMYALIPCGLLAMKMIGEPGLHCVRGADIIRLMTIGFCGGVFFAGLMLRLNSKTANRP